MRKIAALALLFAPLALAGEFQTLYLDALRSDPRLNISRAEVQVGEARLDQATAQLLPQASVGASWTENDRRVVNANQRDSYKGERYNIVIQQEVFDLAKWYARNAEEQLAAGSLARFAQTESEVTVDLVELYLAAMSAQDDLELTESELRTTEKQLQQLRSRYKRQLAVLTDVLEVEARVDGIRADKIAAQAQVQISLESLSELVGRPITAALPALDQELAVLLPLNQEEWLNSAVANNPGLKALQREIDSALEGVKEARAGHYPTVDLTLSGQKSNIGFENSSTSRTETYVASLNLSVPLYQGGGTEARKREQKARLSIAQQRYDRAYRETLRQVREAYLNTVASQSRMTAADKAVKSAEKSYQAQQKGFDYGTVTVVDVLDALRELNRFRGDFRQAQYDLVRNWMQLLSFAGALNSEHIIQLDGWEVARDSSLRGEG